MCAEENVLADPIPCTGNPSAAAVIAPPAHQWAPRILLGLLHVRRRPGRRATRCATFARTIRTADTLSLAAGVLLGAWSIRLLPAATVGVTMLAELLVSSRYRWRFKPSLIDDLPPTIALLGAIMMVSSTTFLLTGYPSEARDALGAAVIVLATTLFGRAIAYLVVRTLRQRGIGMVNAVIVGSGGMAERLAGSLVSDSGYGVCFVGFISDGQPSTGRYPTIGSIQSLKAIICEQRIDLVLVASGTDPSGDVVGGVRELCQARCEVYAVLRLPDLPLHHQFPDLVGCTPLVRLSRTAFRGPSWPLKRVLDVLIAGVVLIVIVPILPIIALAVRRELGPGVIFKQQRIGLDGRPFTLYKFRSLAPVAGEGDTRWNIDGDPRLGPVGRFIRSTSLDELPQLVNVLKGDMSLVGPRPERPFFADQFGATIPGYRHRHRVPAGLTGYAAVSGLRGDTSIADRALFDNLYADSWSLWLDVKIVLRTLGEVCRRVLSGFRHPIRDKSHPADVTEAP